MKRMVVVLALLVVSGILGVGVVSLASSIFRPRFPENLGIPHGQASNVPRLTRSIAAVTAEAAPASLASTSPPEVLPAAQVLAPSEVAALRATPPVSALPDAPPAAVAQMPPAPPSQAKRAFDATEKEIRSLSDGHCGGRTMQSIAILPDGRVQVQC